MRFFAVAASLLGFSSSAFADLSWEYVDERTRQAEELLEQRPQIEAIADRERAKQAAGQAAKNSSAETQAYDELGQALASHPEMAEVNLAEYSARQDYQKAVNGGNPIEISLAIQSLTKAKAARYQKAASIPELKLAIDKWQMAANGIAQSDAESPGIKSGLEAIQAKLKSIGEALGR